MSETLCKKCKTFLTGYGMSGLADRLHCHHKPELEEKERCWCEMAGERRIQLHDKIINKYGYGYYQMRGAEIAKYCPICGKKIEREVKK
jgi:hypothetical protein